MNVIDERGRLFGRVNLVDAAVLIFLIGLVPVAYGAFLLFRPSAPHITSVTRVEITSAERRIAAGSTLSAKLKVRGSGFNPMLRATIGGAPALGFVFENPNSADVLVGAVPPGDHDLVLFDGVQEVARAADAVEIQPVETTAVRVAGWLVRMDPGVAARLEPGVTWPGGGVVVALGPIEPGRSRVGLGTQATDLAMPGLTEREAVLDLACDAAVLPGPCAVAGQPLRGDGPIPVTVPGPEGPLALVITDVLPATPARPARIRVRLTGGSELDLVRVGDEDAFLDARRAKVTAVESRAGSGVTRTATVSVEAGLDESRDGWRYRGRLVRAGEPFTLETRTYTVHGIVEGLRPVESQDGPS